MFELPERTVYNRKIPKSKFYEKLGANSRLKDLFVEQIDSIIWKHKLSKATMNLEPTPVVQEIQIFELLLRQSEISKEILESIDKAIPYPILYVLRYKTEAKLMIAYKQPNQKNENRSVVHNYYESSWQPLYQLHIGIGGALTLEALYENMICHLMLSSVQQGEKLADVIARQVEIEKIERECERLEAKLRSEKQFNKKVEINVELQRIRKVLEPRKG